MQPIVNGLQDEFQGRLAFEQVDAATEEGQARLRAYRLRGHPSYAIVDPEGKALWSFSGQIGQEQLRQPVEQYAAP